ncbi:very short patch repair endonuclease [Pararhodospirillum oryzae]|uniref:very short patch repair endonuclease n=1 Tax=Pararhodospirillum oryzae TaxID=478448 RepID=UPI001C3FC713|nr:DNA mismatch endonuclease Vsr [Pararhodospirillum oryzae]
MMDTLTKTERSERMRRIRGRDTAPEWVVRRLVHAMGYRYRLHVRDLPGKPDLVFRGRRCVIFVHGCFWHRHDCHLGRLPKSNLQFWLPKFEANKERDARTLSALDALGWRVLTVWECELVDKEKIRKKIMEFLEGTGR